MKDICHKCHREYELRSQAGEGVCDSCRFASAGIRPADPAQDTKAMLLSMLDALRARVETGKVLAADFKGEYPVEETDCYSGYPGLPCKEFKRGDRYTLTLNITFLEKPAT